MSHLINDLPECIVLVENAEPFSLYSLFGFAKKHV